MNNPQTIKVALTPIGQDENKNQVFGSKVKLPNWTEFEMIYVEQTPTKKSSTYGDFYTAGTLSYNNIDLLVTEREGVNNETKETYKYLSATVEKDMCYVTLRKNQPVSFKFSSDPEKRKQYTYNAVIRFENEYYNSSASSTESTDDDLPFN